MKHVDYTFNIEARDVPGVMVRIAQVFARRGCNIRSLVVKPPQSGSSWSIITIEAYDISRPDQIEHQLEKLIDVHKVTITHKTVNG